MTKHAATEIAFEYSHRRTNDPGKMYQAEAEIAIEALKLMAGEE